MKDSKQQQLDPSIFTGNPVLSDEWYRTIELTGIIEEEFCSQFVHAMHKLLNEDPNEMITILISSNGGSVEEAFAMYDLIRHARKTCTVRTICYSRAYSAGSLILACGSIGHRYAYPSSTAMIHGLQLEGLVMGHVKTATLPMVQNALDDYKRFVDYFAFEMLKEIDDQGEEVCKSKESLDALVEELARIMNQDTYLNADQMVEIGLVDKIGIPELERIENEDEIQFEGEKLNDKYQNDAVNAKKWNLIEVEDE